MAEADSINFSAPLSLRDGNGPGWNPVSSTNPVPISIVAAVATTSVLKWSDISSTRPLPATSV